MADADRLARARETLSQLGLTDEGDPRSSLARTTMGEGRAAVADTLPLEPHGGAGPAGALASLPPMRLREAGSGEAASPDQFQVLRTIGQGGMGRVELARQPGLGREVAVKRLREGAGAGEATASRALIREARLMGALEHPNIPPIYALGRSDDGPALAMKRIEGASWAALLDDREHPYWAQLGGDRLERNLEILMQVCQAAHFAHAHETLHLDIKPDNVMLGRFGEAYLIDWGVARRFDEVAEGAAGPESPRIVGTPAYMAPEMLRGAEHTGPATDVYLLGATLHEIITGEPRHARATLLMTLVAADESAPFPYGPEVHAELAAIANRACDVDPARRFATPLALRGALEGYLHLRSSLALIDAAAARLIALRERAAEVEPDKALSQALHGAFIECRFGFEQALGKAPDNARARAGWREAYALMIDAELTARNAGAAEALMAVFPEASAEQRARLERLREALAGEAAAHARLAAIERDLQPRDGSWTRTAAIVVGSLLWLVVIGGMGMGARVGWFEVTPTHNLAVGAIFLVAGLAPIARRDAFFHNRVIKQSSTLIVMAGVVLVAARIVALIAARPLWETAIADMMTMAMLMGAVEVIIGKLLHGALMAVALTGAVVVAALAPPYAYEVTGALMAALNFKLAWDMRPVLEAERAPERATP